MCLRPYQACVFAAAWSILQSILHLSWCIWGINLFECRFEIDNSTFTYFWYLTYFYRNVCINATFDFIKVIPVRSVSYITLDDNEYNYSKAADNLTAPQNNKYKIVFPPESAATIRTHSILTTYCTFDALWIIAAVLLLHGVGLRIKYCWSTVFYFPWVVVLFFLMFMDGVVGCWYLVDVFYTYGITNWFLFIGAENQTIFKELEKTNPPMSSTYPSFLMSLLCSRFLFVWGINLFLFFRIMRVGMDVYKGIDYDEEDYDDESKPSNQGHLEQVDVANNDRPRDFQVTHPSPKSAAVRIRRWQLYYGTDDEEEEREERRHPRRRSRQKSVTVKEGWQRDTAFQYNQGAKTGINLAVIGGYEGDRSTSPSPLPDCDRKAYTPGYESKDFRLPFNEQQSSVPSSSSDYAEVYQARQSKPCVSELRSQLPWSYFQDPNELVMPKSRSHTDVMPPIPIPDYTVEVNHKAKSKTNVL